MIIQNLTDTEFSISIGGRFYTIPVKGFSEPFIVGNLRKVKGFFDFVRRGELKLISESQGEIGLLASRGIFVEYGSEVKEVVQKKVDKKTTVTAPEDRAGKESDKSSPVEKPTKKASTKTTSTKNKSTN